MPHLSRMTGRLFQAAMVFGMLAGCAEQEKPDDGPPMRGGDVWIKMDDMKCQQMMQDMPPEHIQIMQNCMGANAGLREDIHAETNDQMCRKTIKAIAAEHMALMRSCMGPNMSLISGHDEAADKTDIKTDEPHTRYQPGKKKKN
ncbi:MAG: hypothetical protein WDO70_02215 [Alphaproteobacteria bacterium]